MRFCICNALLKLWTIAQAAVSEEGFDLQDIKNTKDNRDSPGIFELDFEFTYHYSLTDSNERPLTLEYFDEAFTKIETNTDALNFDPPIAIAMKNLDLKNRKIYGKTRIFLSLFYRGFERFQRVSFVLGFCVFKVVKTPIFSNVVRIQTGIVLLMSLLVSNKTNSSSKAYKQPFCITLWCSASKFVSLLSSSHNVFCIWSKFSFPLDVLTAKSSGIAK